MTTKKRKPVTWTGELAALVTMRGRFHVERGVPYLAGDVDWAQLNKLKGETPVRVRVTVEEIEG